MWWTMKKYCITIQIAASLIIFTATPVDAQINYDGLLHVDLAHIVGYGEGHHIQTTLTNISNIDLCISSDIIANPQSRAPASQLRHNGKMLKATSPGYLLPQAPGFRTLKAGEIISMDFNLDGRFKMSKPKFLHGGIWEARIGIRSFPCSTPINGLASMAWSGWSRIALETSHP
jgi:hypothetical protein